MTYKLKLRHIMAKRDNKDIFENIENSEPMIESHQEENTVVEHVEVVFEPEPIKEVVQEPISKPIVASPVIIPIQPKKNPDKLRQIKNNTKKYY